VQLGLLGAGVRHPHPHQHVRRVGLGVVDLDDPVAVAVEDAGVEQLVLRVLPRARPVGGDQVVVGERRLRVVVAPAQPGVARQRVEVPPVLLGVLAVVALVAVQSEDPLLEHPVAPVPQREPEAQPLVDVADPGEPILAPAEGLRARVLVGQVLPGRPVGAVVLAYRPPGAFAHVRAPRVPRRRRG